MVCETESQAADQHLLQIRKYILTFLNTAVVLRTNYLIFVAEAQCFLWGVSQLNVYILFGWTSGFKRSTLWVLYHYIQCQIVTKMHLSYKLIYSFLSITRISF
jgi:hypothetical protein